MPRDWQRGPFSLAEALAAGRQIAEGLDAAHEKGIVHRDLKPANIKITPDGAVKILDFGLAKMHEASAVDQASASTVGVTRDGLILGTPAYMSPEQARGQVVDKRTDIWAFGCVLYEMLSGRAAFSGDNTTDILAAVVDREPNWDLLPPSTPSNVMRVLRRCLEKDPRKRARDIGDVAADLENLSPATPSTSERLRPSRWRGIGIAAATLVGLGAVVAAAVLLLNRGATNPAERRVQFGLTVEQQASDLVTGIIPTPSPDGQMLAFVTSGPDRSDRLGTVTRWHRDAATFRDGRCVRCDRLVAGRTMDRIFRGRQVKEDRTLRWAGADDRDHSRLSGRRLGGGRPDRLQADKPSGDTWHLGNRRSAKSQSRRSMRRGARIRTASCSSCRTADASYLRPGARTAKTTRSSWVRSTLRN